MALTAKQKRFIEEYPIDLNATQAALRAGYSEKTAYSIGHENLKKPEIQKMLQSAIAERSKRTAITQDRVLKEIGAIAFHKATDCQDSDLKYTNKLKALEMLGKHLGMFADGASLPPEDVQPDALSVSLQELGKEMQSDA